MLRIIIIGLWSCLVTGGGLIYGANLNSEPLLDVLKTEAGAGATILSSPHSLVAPVIYDNRVTGFIFSNVSIGLSSHFEQRTRLPINMVLQDSYNEFLIGNEDYQFPQSPSFDLQKFKEGMLSKLNKAFGSKHIISIYVSEVNFVTVNEMRKKSSLHTIFLQEETHEQVVVKKPAH